MKGKIDINMISVIIPTYNREATILRSVKSVLNQTIKEIEVIVVDDASTDKTVQRLQTISDSRLRYIVLERNSGACIARNRGISEAKGDYIAFQDSDDEWRINKLEKQIEIIKEKKVDIVFCKLQRCNAPKGVSEFFPNLKKEGIIPYRILYEKSRVSTQTIMAKKEVFDTVLFDPYVKRGQDYDWILRAARNYTVYYINEVLVDQYYQSNSIGLGCKDIMVDMAEYFLTKYKKETENDIDLYIALLDCKARAKRQAGLSCKRENMDLLFKSKKVKYLVKFIIYK